MALQIRKRERYDESAHILAAHRRGGAKPVAEEPESTALYPIGTVVHFSRNEAIFREGDATRFAYKIANGAVRLCKLVQDGRRQIVQFALPGDYLGISGTGEHALTAEALGDVTAISYASVRLERLGEERSEVRRCLMASLRKEVGMAQSHLVMLGRQNARERVAGFIVSMAEHSGVTSGSLDIPMGRQDIADYLGLTIETICRAISDLKRARIVTVPSRHEISIRSLAALRAIANAENNQF